MMIVKDLRPISFVEESGFKDLMAFCESGYNMPSRTLFISGDKYVTASAVVSVIHALRAKMEPAPDDVAYVKQLKDIASRQLINRWPLELDQVTGDNRKLFSVVLKSAALDPRFKFNCLSPETARYVRSELAAEAIQYVTRTEVVDLPVDHEATVSASERPSTSADHDYCATAVASTSREQSMAAAIDSPHVWRR